MWIAAFILGMVVAMPPGAVSIAGGRRAISFGFWPALFFTFGSTLSDFFYVTLVMIGLAPLLTESEPLRLVMWILGGAWLCWLGWDAIRTPIEIDTDENVVRESRWRSFRAGIAVTLLNPLTVVSWIALAGNFFARWPAEGLTGFAVIGVMLAGVMTWFLGVMWLLSRLRRVISPRILRAVAVIAGLLLVFFGISAWASAVQLLLG